MKAMYFLQKKSILLFCFSLIIASVYAGPVGKEKAQRVAQNFLSHNLKINSSKFITAYEAIMDVSKSHCLMHVFKGENSYIVIAADDRTYPVLAYSNEGPIAEKGKIPAFDWWMDNLAKSIAVESRLKSSVKQEVIAAWDFYSSNEKSAGSLKSTNTVVPLLSTFWSQEGGYNYYCPAFSTGPSGHCVTGCVATAMGQVLRYYKYPVQGNGSHSYSHPAFGVLTANFGTTNYDWANMGATTNPFDIDTLNRNAIAKLIYHCGVGVDMNYNPTESGAYTANVPDVLYNNFKYKRYVSYIERVDYTDDVWTNILMENLDMHNPLIYSGHGTIGGHAWVCDGYDSPTHFHFNWGWSGTSNGMFYINNNLNSGNGDFTAGQGIVVNIVPDSSIFPLCGNKKYTAQNYTFTDGSYTDLYKNNTNCQWLIQPDTLGTDTLKLSFLEFKTEATKDYLTIYDGTTTSAQQVPGSPFSGQTLPSSLTSTSGAFLLVFVSDAANNDMGWKVKYTTIPKVIVGIQENEVVKQLSVYPNPANGKLNISGDFNVSGSVKYNVTNIIGAFVFSSEMNIAQGLQNKSIDISSLKAGIYFLNIGNTKSTTHTKFVVE
ncbi:MAG: C10 family peptidase [Bacteroidota bacterium]